eukprot:COSAG02_NODE_2598_length_8449_cov_59.030042_4_plen_140_part_00
MLPNSSAHLHLLIPLLSANAMRYCYFSCREIVLYEGFPIWRNQNGHFLFHSLRMDPAIWYMSTMFTPADQLSKAHTGEIKQTFQTVALPQARNAALSSFCRSFAVAMAPVYAVPTMHTEEFSRNLWSWAFLDDEGQMKR